MSRQRHRLSPPPHSDPEARAASVLVWVAMLVVALVACALALTGCASTPCVPEVVTIPSPPEIITVLPPAPVIPPAPILLATTPEGLALAAADPAAWLRLLAADLLRALESYRLARQELEAIAVASVAAEH